MLKVGDKGQLIECSSDTYTKGNVTFEVWQNDRPDPGNPYRALHNKIFIVTDVIFDKMENFQYVCYFPDLDITECFTEEEVDFNYKQLFNFNKIWNTLNEI